MRKTDQDLEKILLVRLKKNKQLLLWQKFILNCRYGNLFLIELNYISKSDFYTLKVFIQVTKIINSVAHTIFSIFITGLCSI
jgi:hypothetical protein